MGALTIPVLKAFISGLANPGNKVAEEGTTLDVGNGAKSGGEFDREVFADVGAVTLGFFPPLHFPA